jgi:hypothetical protein
LSNEEKLTPWQQYKKNLGDVRPWDILDPQERRVTAEEAKERLDLCLSCPELLHITKQCKKCGCFMTAKTKFAEAHCPIGRWGKK